MADIFISYSQADRDKARWLATFLQSNTYTVWWDSALEAGDDFQFKIHRELQHSKAVIVIWTEHSVTSQWVRAEASVAFENGKLLPVRDADLAYGSILPPFNNLHTEILTKPEQLLPAIIAILRKPPRVDWYHTLRLDLLTWFGIVGSTLTVLTSLRSLFDLADWAHFLVANWARFQHLAWQSIFALFRIDLPRFLSAPLTFLVLMASIAFAAAHNKRRTWAFEDARITLLSIGTNKQYDRIILWFITLTLMFSVALIIPTWPEYSLTTVVPAANDEEAARALSQETVLIIALNVLSLGISGCLVDIRRLLRRMHFIIYGLIIFLGLSQLSKYRMLW